MSMEKQTRWLYLGKARRQQAHALSDSIDRIILIFKQKYRFLDVFIRSVMNFLMCSIVKKARVRLIYPVSKTSRQNNEINSGKTFFLHRTQKNLLEATKGE